MEQDGIYSTLLLQMQGGGAIHARHRGLGQLTPSTGCWLTPSIHIYITLLVILFLPLQKEGGMRETTITAYFLSCDTGQLVRNTEERRLMHSEVWLILEIFTPNVSQAYWSTPSFLGGGG